jgi:acyl-CoA reductase-like NAD-dependent aldehyde dehydrogenase
MTAYKTEIFGPVLCVISVDTLEEAIEVSWGQSCN